MTFDEVRADRPRASRGRLANANATELRELLIEAWLEEAPKRLADAHEDELLGR